MDCDCNTSNDIIFECEIPEETCLYIQALLFEKDARENLILSIVSAGLDMDSGNGKKIYDEYINYAIEYNLVMDEIQTTFVPLEIRNQKKTWNLDFIDRVLTVRK